MTVTSHDSSTDALKNQILALNDDASEKCQADRVATSRIFLSMSELFDTALIRTPGMVDQLWNNREKRLRTLYEHVEPCSQAEELMVLNDTLVSCSKSLQAVNQPLFDALVSAFRMCGQQQVPEAKVHDKAQMLYNQLMRDPSVLNACFCISDADAKSLFTPENGCVARAFARLKNIPIDGIQECIASGARARGVFAVGGVNGFSNEYFDSTAHFLEPLEHLHSNMANLVAHVWHSMKDHMSTMPEEQKTHLKVEIFEKLWPFRRHRASATAGAESSKRDSTLDATAATTAGVVQKYHQRLLAAQPDLVGTGLSSEQLAAKVKTHLKDLLVKFQKAITPASPSSNCTTHIVAVHAGVFVAVVQLRSAGSSEPISVEVHPHDIRAPAPLWAGSQPRSPGSGVIWERFSSLAMRALCYYMDRAKISGERHPGATAISDLMMWLATYCVEPATNSHLQGAVDSSAPSASKLDDTDGRAGQPAAAVAGQQGAKAEKGRRDERAAHGLLTHNSAMSAKPFSRDPETNGMLPAIWRPYRVPSAALCRSVASGAPVMSLSPLHLPEVEPEQQ